MKIRLRVTNWKVLLKAHTSCLPWFLQDHFPRGFLWDEGFHLLPLLNYDSDLVLEITKSWFNLIDEDGWIAREQILGKELRSRVPAEFVVQSPQIVNPPTLTLVLTYLLDSVVGNYDTINEPKMSMNHYQEKLGGFVLKTPKC